LSAHQHDGSVLRIRNFTTTLVVTSNFLRVSRRSENWSL